MITLNQLQERRDVLSATLIMSENDLDFAKEKAKAVRKEIANMKGAIIEIERFIESHE